MGKNLDNLSHFILNSDYPMDKIVWLYETQCTLDSSGMYTIQIKNDLPYKEDCPIFVKGLGSLDNWQSSFVLGTYEPIANSQYNNSILEYRTGYDSAGGSGRRISVDFSFEGFPNATVKVRLWGVQREDIPLAYDYGKTTGNMYSKTPLKFDSGKNYPRLIKDGVAYSGDKVYHNLGRIPYIDYWQKYWGSSSTDTTFQYGYSYNGTGHLGDNLGYNSVRATKDYIQFMQYNNGGSPANSIFYYRVYG